MEIETVSAERFRQLSAAEQPLLAEFWAPWCVYCRRLAPALEAVAGQWAGKIAVCQVNIDTEPSLAAAQRISVVPTLVLLRNGEDLGRLEAPDSLGKIDGFLRDCLKG